MVTAGPSRPSVYATRPETRLAAEPVDRYPSVPASSMSRPYSWAMWPTYTPVALPARVFGSMPAFSSASQATSSTSRCCGSIASASPGLIPKNPASNSAAPSRNPPSRT